MPCIFPELNLVLCLKKLDWDFSEIFCALGNSGDWDSIGSEMKCEVQTSEWRKG